MLINRETEFTRTAYLSVIDFAFENEVTFVCIKNKIEKPF